jgi:MinD-like ATPase involved in chromosome partitioning or flagellar assembly
LIDTHPGIGENTLLSISISDSLLIIMRPDSQDYQGTAVAVEQAKKMEVPSMYLIVNKVLPSLDASTIKAEVEDAYDVPVGGNLPFSEEMMELASSGIFCQEHPEHPITKSLHAILNKVK